MNLILVHRFGKEYLIQKTQPKLGFFNLFGMNRAVNVDHLVM